MPPPKLTVQSRLISLVSSPTTSTLPLIAAAAADAAPSAPTTKLDPAPAAVSEAARAWIWLCIIGKAAAAAAAVAVEDSPDIASDDAAPVFSGSAASVLLAMLALEPATSFAGRADMGATMELSEGVVTAASFWASLAGFPLAGCPLLSAFYNFPVSFVNRARRQCMRKRTGGRFESDDLSRVECRSCILREAEETAVGKKYHRGIKAATKDTALQETPTSTPALKTTQKCRAQEDRKKAVCHLL